MNREKIGFAFVIPVLRRIRGALARKQANHVEFTGILVSRACPMTLSRITQVSS